MWNSAMSYLANYRLSKPTVGSGPTGYDLLRNTVGKEHGQCEEDGLKGRRVDSKVSYQDPPPETPNQDKEPRCRRCKRGWRG